MTYCVAVVLDAGMVFASDSRTSAGVDHVSSFRKMRLFASDGDRMIVILSSGNLSITQNVVNILDHHVRSTDSKKTIMNLTSMIEVAELVGDTLREVKHRDGPYLQQSSVDASATLLVGGQIRGERQRLFHVYNEGNFIEATRMPGRGALILTGQLGDVMKESARAAISLVKANAVALGIDPLPFEKADIHIHVPAGAIPKDGPSAGVAISTALASEMSGRPVRRDIAMTGEITLRGRVLPIGGVKEKVLGAVRAGIKTIIVPKENEPDLEDLPEDVRKTLEVHLVEDLGQVLSLALRGARYEAGHLVFEGEAPREPRLVRRN